jgi:dTDP-4-dehydrorhamnose reductase
MTARSDLRWLVTGASGALGGYVVRQLLQEAAPANVFALAGRSRVEAAGANVAAIDFCDRAALTAHVRAVRPDVILHLGGVTSLAAAADAVAHARRVNVDATRALADAAAEVGARLLFTSTDMAFDGKSPPYREDDPLRPTNAYGQSKVDAERAVLVRPGTLVVRLPLMYGFALTGRETTFAQQIAALRDGRPVRLFTDEFRAPLWLGDAAAALIALGRTPATGVMHVSGPERLSRYALIEQCAAVLGVSTRNLVPIRRADVPGGADRPADLVLDDSRFRRTLPDVRPRPVGPHVFSRENGGG